MKNRSSSFRVSITHLKVLDTILNLNQENAFPSVEGVAKILNGVNDFETKAFSSSSTFATLLSYRGRKLTSLVTTLVRRGFLKYIYKENSNVKFLQITAFGKTTLFLPENAKKRNFKSKANKYKETIFIK
ncbi:MAG: hypothetical protein WCX85_02795 [Bacilli bacterium]|jgi:hypothetical protein|nr:hypothetical protein [Bacilli bacterium]